MTPQGEQAGGAGARILAAERRLAMDLDHNVTHDSYHIREPVLHSPETEYTPEEKDDHGRR